MGYRRFAIAGTIAFLICTNVLQAGDGGVSLEPPTDEWSAKDELDVDQKAKDKKIWRNMLKWYLNARQIAKASLKTMENVRDWAWTAHKYLAAVENLSQRAETIYTNAKELSGFRLGDVVGIIEHLEEEVFQQTDAMFYHDIPHLRKAREDLQYAREQVLSGKTESYEQIKGYLADFQGYRKKYAKLGAINSMDNRVYLQRHRPEVKRHVYATHVAQEAMAAADVRTLALEQQSLMLGNTARLAGEDNGELTPTGQSEAKTVTERNRLILNVQENEYVKSGIKVATSVLLNRIYQIDRGYGLKTAWIGSAERFAEALKEYEEQQKAAKQ